ncbi:MAG: agmatine deiminase family protein [Candidatus Cloacimonetes bacterium]|nr:agmatine deiminase family protein [Candidatus Cloacimonadota bacterium]
MKSEFEKHQYTILLYPERSDVWRMNADPIKRIVENLAEFVSEFEPVILGYNENNVPSKMNKLNYEIHFKKIDYDDIWVRDTGAIPIFDDIFTAFQYDAYGGLIGDVTKDSTVAQQITQILKVKIEESSLVLEGGNIVSDGNGTLLLVKESVIKRNSISIEDIEKELKQVLKIKQIIWINRGLVFDETGGHIDNICTFADSNTVILSWTDDKNNPQYHVVREAFKTLEKSENINGIPYKIVKIPTPDIFFASQDDREGIEIREDSKKRLVGDSIQASYINFMFVNGGIIAPQFGVEQDKKALEVFQQTFPNRKIVPFNAREVVLGGGGIHCISRNI